MVLGEADVPASPNTYIEAAGWTLSGQVAESGRAYAS